MIKHSAVICQSQTHGMGRSTITEAPIEPSLRICQDCLASTAKCLSRMPLLYSELEHKLTTSSRQRSWVAPTRTAANRWSCLNEELLETRAAIHDTLWSWSQLVADERNVTLNGSARQGLKHLVRFLMTHLHWLAAHQAATDFVDEIHDLAATGRTPHEQALAKAVSAHTCIMPGCGAGLVAAVGSDADRFAAHIRCGAGHLWNADQWLVLKREIERKEALNDAQPGRRLVSTKAAAVALGVPEATIRQWARRGKLTRHGSSRRAQYDLDELTRLAERRWSEGP
jgi:MerR HTH family regulatory protein